MNAPVVLLTALLAVGCAKREPETAFASWVFVQGENASGKGLAYDPALPPWKEGSTHVGSRRRMAWAARDEVLQQRMQWWQGAGIPLEPREIPELDWSLMRQDTERLAQWFADKGWESASVRVRTERAALWFNKKDDDRFWRVIYVVDPGERSFLGEVTLTGESGLPVATRSALRKALPLPGTWTSAASREVKRLELERVLSDHGYAHAKVASSVSGDVLRPHLVLRVDAGVVPTLTSVAIRTDEPLDVQRLTKVVRRRIVAGRSWDGSMFGWFEDQLSGRPEIATAFVRASEPDPDTHVDVEITPESAKMEDFGVRAGVTGALLAVGVRLDWARRGLGGRLLTLSGSSSLDYRLFDSDEGLFTGITHGPGSWNHIELDGALAPLAGLSAYVRADARFDTFRGYVSLLGQGETGFRWKPWGQSQVRAFVRAGYVHTFPWPWQTEPFDRTFKGSRVGSGEWFRRSYDLVSVGVAVDIDRREHDFASERGTRFHAELIPWGRSGSTNWARFSFDLQWHGLVQPGRFVVIARVAAGGHIIDDHESGSLITNRFFLGGPGNGRGFGFRRLGSPGSTASLQGVQIGGDFMGFVSIDGRIQLHPAVFVSPFVEVGRVWASGLDQRVEGSQRLAQQGIRIGQLQPVAGVTFVLATAGRWVEVSPGFRLTRETHLADRVPVMALQLRLRPDPRR